MSLKKQMNYTNPNRLFSHRIIVNYYIVSYFCVDFYYYDFGFMFQARTMQFLKSKKLFKDEKEHHCSYFLFNF